MVGEHNTRDETMTLRNPPTMTLKEMEESLNKVQGALGQTPPCSNPADPCPSKYHGKTGRNGKSLFWYGSDCTLPAKKFCDPCLAYWHVAVARNILLSEIRKAEAIEFAEKNSGHRLPSGEWIPAQK
jgi:hypothetical protein